MFYRLPPVGEAIPRGSARDGEDAEKLFAPYGCKFYASGTQALAAAVMAAIKLKGIGSPEVLLPAYSCPALVSAVLYAQARPILVDLEKNRPWMDLDQLAGKICQRTTAIIAVHLFGIPERLRSIAELSKQAGAFLVEDSAQCLPPLDNRTASDFVVLSFGRGKPVSLLHGGTVLATRSQTRESLVATPQKQSGLLDSAAFNAKAGLYNLFRSPSLYWIPATLPFMRLGETRFEPLASIDPMDQPAMKRLPAAVNAYRRTRCESQYLTAQMVSGFAREALIDLPRVCCDNDVPRLLRYPLLVTSSNTRNLLLHGLSTAGLGASSMYATTLPRISGLEQILADQGPFPNAEEFSRALITLPTHAGVKSADIHAMEHILEKTLRGARP
jgi:dTDP-4-amino-4,6-dideoxygalactose transaminase